MLTPWSDFYSLVIPYTPGAPAFVIENAVHLAAIEFCKQTLIHRQVADELQTYVGEITYEYEPPQHCAVESVLKIAIDGVSLTRELPSASINALAQSWQRPRRFITLNEGQFQVDPAPDKTYTMQLVVALKPTRRAPGIDASIFEHYADVIAMGAVASLLLEPKTLWFDPQLANYHHQKFTSAMNAIHQRDLRDIPLRVQYNPF
jgi:hypothetical protein